MSRRKNRSPLGDTYNLVFGSPDGRRVLHDILDRAGVLQVSTVWGDPYATHYRDGRRALALEILQQLRWTEAEVVALSQEKSAELIETAAADTSAIDTSGESLVEVGDAADQ